MNQSQSQNLIESQTNIKRSKKQTFSVKTYFKNCYLMCFGNIYINQYRNTTNYLKNYY